MARGAVGDAERVVGWLERAAERVPSLWTRIAARRGRAALLEGGDVRRAEEAHREALELLDAVELPLERVEALTAYGAFLRRSRRGGRARRLLGDAIELADACGAALLARAAGEELALVSGRARRAGRTNGLTPAEERVRRLAAMGKSNREIAAQLVISHRTVETHLHRVYRKLGVRSRRELIATGTSATGADGDA
jgi:DNA-binding CsgD family transcriptional regulator